MPPSLPTNDDLLDGFEPLEDNKAAPPAPAPAATGISPESKAMMEKIESLQSGVASSTLLSNVLAMPEVQAVIQARQMGKPVKVVPTDDTQAPAPARPEPNWDEFKEDPKKLAEFLVSRMAEESAKSTSSLLEAKLKPVLEEMNTVKQSISKEQADKATNSILEARKKYADFDQVLPKMRELHAQVQGTLNVEQLYKLAKIDSGAPDVTNPNQVSSERPTASAPRAPATTEKKSYPLGRRGMKQALNDALAHYDLEAQINSD